MNNKPVTAERKVGNYTVSVRSYTHSGKGAKGVYVYVNGAFAGEALNQWGGPLGKVNARIPAFMDSLSAVVISEMIMAQMEKNKDTLVEVNKTRRELMGEQDILKRALRGEEPPVECPKFVEGGGRAGQQPYNEGQEYILCTCGAALGAHSDKVVKATGINL